MDTIKRLWDYTEKRHKNLKKALVFSFVRNGLAVTQLLAVIAAVRVLTGELELKAGVLQVVLCTLICVIGGFAASYFEQTNALETGMYTVADQRSGVAARLRLVPLGFFHKITPEHIIATLTTTLQGVEMAASMTMIGIVSGFFSAAAMCLFMLFYDWRMGLIMGVGVMVYLLVVRWQMKTSRRDAPARQKAQTELSGRALTFLQGIRVTKAFCADTGDEDMQAAVRASCDENIALTNRSMPSQFAAHLTIAVFESLLLAADLYFTFTAGEYTVGKSVVLLMFSFFAYASLNQAGSILSMIGMLESGLDEAARLQKAEKLPQEQPVQHPVSDEVVMERVDFSYGDHQVLHDISARFRPGTLTAIIGPSGSGKTTLCKLIARFHDADRGAVTVGGANVKNIPYEELMKKIGIVFQNVYLFEDTVLNNIRFGRPDATLEEVRAAAKAARCDDFIMALPDGYNTLVREGGSSLSGGEKQRISIARAMLKDSPIIILDEATSALDGENEKAFFDAVDELTRSKTVIMIAHRLSTVRRADYILAVREGRLVQKGTPEELAGVPGLYADFLASRQEAAGWKLQN